MVEVTVTDTTKPLAEPVLTSCKLVTLEQTSVKFESKSIFFGENAFENVCKMLAILLRPVCVTPYMAS